MQPVEQQGEGKVIGLYYNKDGSTNGNMKPIYENYFQDSSEVVVDYNGDISKYTIHDMAKHYQNLRYALYRNEPRNCDDYVKCIVGVTDNVPDNIERAMIAHNLLFYCSISTVFRIGLVGVNGEILPHAYSLICNNGEYFLFDAFYKVGHFDPIVIQISKEQYDSIIGLTDDIDITIAHDGELYHGAYVVTYYSSKSKPKESIVQYAKDSRETL